MARLARINMLIGFTVLFFAACSGPFLAQTATEAFLYYQGELNSWSYTLLASAHGHSSLFGVLHCLFALSLRESLFSLRLKYLQTAGLVAGSLAMSLMLVVRAFSLPEIGFDMVGVIIGTMLSCALLSLGSHCVGIAGRLLRYGI